MQHAEMRGSLRVKCSSQGEYVEMKKKCQNLKVSRKIEKNFAELHWYKHSY